MKRWIFITLIASILGGCSSSISRKELYEGGISYDGENMTFSHTPPISFYNGGDFVECIENDSIFYADIFIYGPSEYSDSYKEKSPGIEFKFIMHNLPEKGKKYRLGTLYHFKLDGDNSESSGYLGNWNTSMPDIIGVAMTDRFQVKGLKLLDSIDKSRVSKAGFLSGEITNGWVMFESMESSLSEADNYPDGSPCRRHAFKITYGFDTKMMMVSDSTVTRDIHVEGWFNMNRNQRDKKLFFFSTDSTINWYLNDFYDEDGSAI